MLARQNRGLAVFCTCGRELQDQYSSFNRYLPVSIWAAPRGVPPRHRGLREAQTGLSVFEVAELREHFLPAHLQLGRQHDFLTKPVGGLIAAEAVFMGDGCLEHRS